MEICTTIRLILNLRGSHGDSVLVRKSLKQFYRPSPDVLALMQEFRQMTNECIRIGLANDSSSMKRLCNLSYNRLDKSVLSIYRLTANSKAAGILAARKKSVRRGVRTKDPK